MTISDREKEIFRRHYLKYRDKILAKQKRYYEKNKKRILESHKKYFKEWYQKHREQHIQNVIQRRNERRLEKIEFNKKIEAERTDLNRTNG